LICEDQNDSMITLQDGAAAKWTIGQQWNATASRVSDLLFCKGAVMGSSVMFRMKHSGTSAVLTSHFDDTNYSTITTAANGGTTIATTDSDGSEANLTLDVNGGLHIDTDSGEARITTAGSAYTPVHEQDIVIKGYVDGIKHTAVWGGNLGRVNVSGTWLGIPTGYQAAIVRMGTGSSPDTSFTLTVTADDLVGSIWASMHDITVTGCKIWVGQGGSTNTAHGVSLMRYDIDADGDLSNGVEVAAGSALNLDDYTQARAITLSLSGTAANLDIDFSDGQILMAFVEPTAAYNANLGAKVILEYTEVET
jgi:hypothetical protein